MPNHLDRSFDVTQPNDVWVRDIAHIRTDEDWLYLAVLTDLFGRKMVKWSMSESLDRQVCVAVLDMAVKARKPPKGLMHHSDRGSQYASRQYTCRLREAGIIASMSRVRECWDNAVVESFFSRLKTELISQRRFATTTEARTAIFDQVEAFHNLARAHSHGSYKSPVQYENQAVSRLTK